MKDTTTYFFAEARKEKREREKKKEKRLIVSRASSLALGHFRIGRALILQES